MKNESLTLIQNALSLTAGLVVSLLLSLPANAAPGAAADTFQHNTNTNTPHHLPTSAKIDTSDKPMVGAGAGAMFSTQTPAVAWFTKFDDLIGPALPTTDERFILSQGLNQELERVQQMTRVYIAISTRYRRLAKELRALPVQANWPGVKEYRDHKADFFDDEAACFEDLVKPRQASATIEELRERLQGINARSAALKSEGRTLTAMDRDLRQTYRMHAPRYSDALYKYVSSKEGQPKK